MIGGEIYERAAGVLGGLPPHVDARIESPTPGPEIDVHILEITVGPETGTDLHNTQAVNRAFAEANLAREDKGRSVGRFIPVPLEYRGSQKQDDNRRRLLYAPTGQVALA